MERGGKGSGREVNKTGCNHYSRLTFATSSSAGKDSC